MMKRRTILACSAAITLLMGTACSRDEGAAGGGAGSKEMVLALDTSPTNLDSRVGNDQGSGRMFDLIYAGLVKFTAESDHAPDLAERWEVSPDSKTITFTLRPNLTFQDGRPLTSRDVLFTYQSLMEDAFTSPKKSGYSSVASFEAPDERTFVIHMTEPNAGIFDNLTLGILPAGADTNVFKTTPVGAGPYKVVDFRQDEQVVLEAFDGYHAGPPAIERIVVRVIPDATTRVLELRNRSIDFVLNAIPFDAIAPFKQNNELEVIAEPGAIYQYLAFNLKDPILAKKEVRQAIAHGIDRGRIVNDLLLGYGAVTNTLFPPSHWAHAPNVPDYPFDQNRAKQLLDQAGYRDPDGDGPRSRFSINYRTSTDAEANQQAQMIQQMLKGIGVDVQIQSNEFATFYDDIQKGNYQMFSLRRAGVSDPDFYTVIFHSGSLPPEGQNRGYYVNRRLDQILDEARSTFDRSRRRELYQEAQRILAEDVPYVSLYHRSNVAIMERELEGYTMYPSGFLLSIPDMSWGG
ncbi:MAG TPA: ABC transporter substrate-binding protein [Thermoanaerobaculia bacterium]|nr:ABC transporter substrate-binding protein [Thermoanaerobaculia bacterium]